MYENNTLKELKEIAKNKGLKGYSGLKKNELIEYLRTGKLKLQKKKANIDETAKRELELWIDNTETLYRQKMSIYKNLDRKQINGTYDKNKSVKLFLYMVDAGAKDYTKRFGGNWNTIFNRDTRISLAEEYAKEYLDESKYDLELKKKIMERKEKMKKKK
ncbi:MAG: Rho termination factor N-terminal domain-containing protein [Candidatus Thorarchaeota archaeon]